MHERLSLTFADRRGRGRVSGATYYVLMGLRSRNVFRAAAS
jgi:hypothetical protein